jgi:rhodanese-related sulfurtransferase
MAIAEITVDELETQLSAGGRLIDVREPAEYDEAHVPGAVLVPLATVPDHVDAFRGDGPTYVICRTGGRSMRACEFVAEHGIDVVNVAGGTMAWITSGREYATGTATGTA